MKLLNIICCLIAIPTLVLAIWGACYGWKGQLFLFLLLITALPFYFIIRKKN